MTNEQIEDLKRSADQAQAHGKIATAQWYRCWAETGKQVGEKPEETGRQTYGTAE